MQIIDYSVIFVGNPQMICVSVVTVLVETGAVMVAGGSDMVGVNGIAGAVLIELVYPCYTTEAEQSQC